MRLHQPHRRGQCGDRHQCAQQHRARGLLDPDAVLACGDEHVERGRQRRHQHRGIDPHLGEGAKQRQQHKDHDRVHHELDRDGERHLPRNGLQRAQRDRDAQSEQRGRGRGVLQELHQAIDGDGRLEVHGGRDDAKQGRQDERMQRDPPEHLENVPGEPFLVGARERHERGHQREQEDIVEAEDQRDRGGGVRSERRQSEPRPHIADIAIAAGEPCHGRARNVTTAYEHPQRKRQHERGERRQRGADDEARVGELIKGRLRDDAVEQRRQRHVDDEEIHPGEPAIGDRLEFSARQSEEDQTEERQRQIDDVEHSRACPGKCLPPTLIGGRNRFSEKDMRHQELGAHPVRSERDALYPLPARRSISSVPAAPCPQKRLAKAILCPYREPDQPLRHLP